METTRPHSFTLLAVLLVVAAGLWCFIFVAEWGNFWGKLTISATILAIWATVASSRDMRALMRMRYRDIGIGILSAVGLYLLFGAGKFVLVRMLPSAEQGIGHVYGLKTQLSGKLVGALLLCLTGLAEEVFWRGYVQRTLTTYLTPVPGIALSVMLYAGVHVCTLNFPLILAAAVAGLFWGIHFHITKSLPSVIISHVVWNCTVFLFLPFE